MVLGVVSSGWLPSFFRKDGKSFKFDDIFRNSSRWKPQITGGTRGKRVKVRNLFSWTINKMKVTVKFIQKLTGTLNFLNSSIVPGRAFMRGMYTKLCLRDSKGRAILTNSRVSIFCDNQSVIHMVNNLALSCPHCMKLIRILALNCIHRNQRLFVSHVRTNFNDLADALSRRNYRKFWALAPQTMKPTPDNISNLLLPPEKLWGANSNYLL